MAAFKASARSLDQGIGAVLNGLHEFGLAERTLIICTTDHGLAFPGAKATLFDRGLGVMLLMRGPGGFTGGKVFNAMVTHLDVYPTICDLARIEHPPWLQGVSLLPLVRGETDRLHDEIFAEMTFHAAYEPVRAVRTERWKYIRRFDDYGHPVLPNCDDSASKDLLVEHGWGEQLVPEEQLYDLVFDPARPATWPVTPATWTCWRRCVSGLTSGWNGPRTRCSRVRSSRHPAPRSMSRISARRETRCELSARIPPTCRLVG